ncbi:MULTISPECIES: hypothetical protein [Streptomyces]|uniref:hypothetical protein n=1 Tax=Streptomyces TaxID=1883 RepID=UPI002248FE9D|nr:hypothetical protein [Streptomyces sp. JHD 1]MCX2969762.1 hypothetical protein [Streptomyces sp. JHD 1]
MKTKIMRTLASAAGAVVMAAGLTGAATAPAQAASEPCPYPYVCFYKGGSVSGQYQDVTSYFQTVSTSSDATSVYNSRNDDVAYVRLNTGSVVCVKPKTRLALNPYSTRVTGIKISWSSTC